MPHQSDAPNVTAALVRFSLSFPIGLLSLLLRMLLQQLVPAERTVVVSPQQPFRHAIFVENVVA